jgi:TPR repeat protein
MTDNREALRWFQKAAGMGSPSAMYNIGWCFEVGAGVAADTAEALMWYSKAAELGHAGARERLRRGDGRRGDGSGG